METSTKFKDNTSGQEVFIKEKNGEMLVLSNGVKIKTDFFIKKFTPIYGNSTEQITDEISPDSFFGQKTDYLTESKKTKIEEDIKLRQQEIINMQENINKPTEEVDPIDFLHSPSQVGTVAGLDEIMNMDSSQIRDVPDSQGSKVMIKESIDGEGGYVQQDASQQPKTANEIAEGKRLSEGDLNRYKQIDEDDDAATQDFLKKEKKDRLEATGGKKTNIAQQRADITNQPQLSDEEEISGNKPTHLNKTPEPVDFISQMFKSFKRNHKISVTLQIEDHISEPEFIKLMSNNLDADIIGLYTQEILGRVLSDVVGLEQKIHDVIEKEVYGEVKKNKIKEVNELEVELFPADKTKTNKQRYYFYDHINDIVVKLLKETGKKKNLTSATMKQIKKYKNSK